MSVIVGYWQNGQLTCISCAAVARNDLVQIEQPFYEDEPVLDCEEAADGLCVTHKSPMTVREAAARLAGVLP